MNKKEHKYDACPKCELEHDHMACAKCLGLRMKLVAELKKQGKL